MLAMMTLTDYIRDIPDYPKPGIVFKDITPLLQSPKALAMAVEQMANPFRGKQIDVVVGAESRGFIFGTAIAQAPSGVPNAGLPDFISTLVVKPP